MTIFISSKSPDCRAREPDRLKRPGTVLTLGPDQLLEGRIVAERIEVHILIKIPIHHPLGNRFLEKSNGGFLFAQERRDEALW